MDHFSARLSSTAETSLLRTTRTRWHPALLMSVHDEQRMIQGVAHSNSICSERVYLFKFILKGQTTRSFLILCERYSSPGYNSLAGGICNAGWLDSDSADSANCAWQSMAVGPAPTVHELGYSCTDGLPVTIMT